MDEEDLLMNYGADDSPSNEVTGELDHKQQQVDLIGSDISGVDPTAIDPTTISAKPRRTQVRLTAEKLLSDKGLPFVIKYAPKRIRISTSKRSAYQNLSNITQFYQLWAHNLFPKANFSDFIKLCHSLGKNDKTLREYRMQLFRSEMLGRHAGSVETSTSPNATPDITGENNVQLESTDISMVEVPTRGLFVSESDATIAPNRGSNTAVSARNTPASDNDSDDDLYSLSSGIPINKETQVPTQGSDKGNPIGRQNPVQPHSFSPEDELDTLNELEAELMRQRQDTAADTFGEEEDEDAIEVMKELGF